MNNQAEIIDEVLTELNRARTKFPTWPDDPIHAAAVVAEESGELVQATLQACYEQKKDELAFQTQLSKVRREAIQTAAMAIRFLVSMDQYMFEAGRQHKQEPIDTAVLAQPSLDEHGFVFIDRQQRPFWCCLIGGDPWFCYWHAEDTWVTLRRVEIGDVAVARTMAIPEAQAEIYHRLHRKYLDETAVSKKAN